MNKYKLIGMCSLIIIAVIFATNASSDESDEAKQQALQKDIEHSLIAPCCWNMTVDQHDSPAAGKVRAKIAEMLTDGKSKEEILAYFVAQPQYGERILATPSQKTLLGKLAYWLIPIALVFGVIVVGMVISRLSQSKTPRQTTPAKTAEKDQSAPSSWDEKVENELNNFE